MKTFKDHPIRPKKCKDCIWRTGMVCAFPRCVKKEGGRLM